MEQLIKPTHKLQVATFRKNNAPAKEVSIMSGWMLKRKLKKGKVSSWKKRFIDLRSVSITYAKEPGKGLLGTFDLFFCQVRAPEATP